MILTGPGDASAKAMAVCFQSFNYTLDLDLDPDSPHIQLDTLGHSPMPIRVIPMLFVLGTTPFDFLVLSFILTL